MADNNALLLDNQLCFALYSTSLAMTQMYKPLLEPLGLTYPQYLVLLILWEQDGIGLKDIGERLGQKSGALTPVIKRMEQEGLVNRTRQLHDERSLDVRLTPKGQQLKEEAVKISQCLLESCGIPSRELLDMKEKIIMLRDNLLKNQPS
ncbi:MarR family winged helix-turn-helix transcriptional regulator [Vibrio gazogenes]|uniref:DNA-binding transcriptional regulator, MarR family n=1 Tax=Vibrio gazogenes DSM 21264 = NBRC 103151 TaxID=1123492 RepID=A0A1M4SVQ9_VIBGA|nr:MarR family transcriptional regulator [Vibrio gazogenes]USP15962.1 MarR family transcriptional regulator [Vibrio gazogenes]SHE36236.1 DNA-binding transcriptional regulator, MarR family [Vibrio gazogenes DSM 21264] [Vibrio gazogenes DSM 21264 = NBRC 103151]SJN54773.1 Organic hydroperoxide resistance transcriptional regulator [Vibrio gazogenes]